MNAAHRSICSWGSYEYAECRDLSEYLFLSLLGRRVGAQQCGVVSKGFSSFSVVLDGTGCCGVRLRQSLYDGEP